MANSSDIVLAKCQHLVASGLWPSEQELPFRAWLNNFSEEQDYEAAIKILDKFVYINEDMAHRAFTCAYIRFLQQVTCDQGQPNSSPKDRTNFRRPTITELERTHNNVYITGIRGENPNPADSSFAYLRAARDKLGFPEAQIVDLQEAVVRAYKGTLVILVDDTVGTGGQVRETLMHDTNSNTLAAALEAQGNVVCLAAVVTSTARDALSEEYPKLRVFAGHFLDTHKYSINTLLPRSHHRDVHELLCRIVQRLSVDSHIDPAYGYESLGLILAFHDSIPDFSLPILWASGDRGWKALKRRHSD